MDRSGLGGVDVEGGGFALFERAVARRRLRVSSSTVVEQVLLDEACGD